MRIEFQTSKISEDLHDGSEEISSPLHRWSIEIASFASDGDGQDLLFPSLNENWIIWMRRTLLLSFDSASIDHCSVGTMILQSGVKLQNEDFLHRSFVWTERERGYAIARRSRLIRESQLKLQRSLRMLSRRVLEHRCDLERIFGRSRAKVDRMSLSMSLIGW